MKLLTLSAVLMFLSVGCSSENDSDTASSGYQSENDYNSLEEDTDFPDTLAITCNSSNPCAFPAGTTNKPFVIETQSGSFKKISIQKSPLISAQISTTSTPYQFNKVVCDYSNRTNKYLVTFSGSQYLLNAILMTHVDSLPEICYEQSF